ncbi:hypothetical protein N0V93_000713 [Gnomoniopsis smithogilvyi]|uniref:Transglycosylase SLT domain-containing protein n=1 Tax=Gnomoniopsis smithogilvyi TaxID=1191159 RepID=A0A9W8Z468_9PEZI|nr:hypothetical protein N0V93_000713 [Gnomoniopsis smithogilvyi]
MHLPQILALVASASLAHGLPAGSPSHSPCERRVLTASIAAAPVRVTPTIVAPPPVPTSTTALAKKPTYTAIAASVPSPSDNDFVVASMGSCTPGYKQSYSGPAYNFPRSSEWMSFVELFACNTPSMRATGDSEQDIENIYAAILQVASNTGIDNRVILAIIMQESHGQVNVKNAGDGQNTPGLMQAQGCPNHAGEAVVSREAVLEMVQCGSDHFKNVDGGASSDEDIIYTALRSYNSGVNGVNRDDLSNSGSGTNSYVSDVANRLMGWVD